jgi:uncharacterized protein (TIGR03083 family)
MIPHPGRSSEAVGCQPSRQRIEEGAVANSQEATIDAIAGCCSRIEAMCAGLDDAAWHRPTALPAWDVQDVVAHLGSLESMLLGRAEPVHQPDVTSHVRNPLGELNERLVDRRRSWSGAEVLAEFRETTGLRLTKLRALDEAELDRQVPSPTGGMVAQGAFLGTRLWDFLVHDMDISEALGSAPDLENAAARRVLDEMLLLLPRAVAKGGTPDGTVVAATITEPLPRSLAVRMQSGRAAATDPATAGEATLHLRASPAVFLRVGAGRRDPAQAIAAGDVEADGDRVLAAGILAALNVVP